MGGDSNNLLEMSKYFILITFVFICTTYLSLHFKFVFMLMIYSPLHFNFKLITTNISRFSRMRRLIARVQA